MERTEPIWERWLGVAGLAYVILHFLFLTHGSAGPDESVRAVQSAFTRTPAQEMQAGVLFQVSSLVLLLFAMSLRGCLRRAEGEPKTLSSTVLGAAFAGTVLAFVGSAMLFVLEANVARLGDANLTYSLMLIWWATFLGDSLMLGVMALAASASALMTRALPRWVGWLGIACGLALIAGCLAFYPSGAVVQGPADSIAYIGEILFAVWSIATSVIILRGRGVARATEVTRLPVEGVPAR
jgi:magnesium-transporting ATPase (P-type)